MLADVRPLRIMNRVVGRERVIAVVSGRFLVLTVPGVQDAIVERARDFDATIARSSGEGPS